MIIDREAVAALRQQILSAALPGSDGEFTFSRVTDAEQALQILVQAIYEVAGLLVGVAADARSETPATLVGTLRADLLPFEAAAAIETGPSISG